MKVKTSELEGAALDLSVAKACGVGVALDVEFGAPTGVVRLAGSANLWRPSTDWSQGGPLIDQHKISLEPCLSGNTIAECFDKIRLNSAMAGPTPLIAACRAIVAAKLGDEVDVPEELL